MWGGHLSKVLVEHGYNVTSSDIVDRGYGNAGVDFLEFCGSYDGDIVTNPPYCKAIEFVRKAIDTVTYGHKVCMFLRLQFLEGKTRRKLFDEFPPKVIYVASARVNCCKCGDFSDEQRKNNSALAYAWFIWEKGYKGEPTLRWFN